MIPVPPVPYNSSRTEPFARSSDSEKPNQFIVDGDGKLFCRCTRPQAQYLQALHYVIPWGSADGFSRYTPNSSKRSCAATAGDRHAAAGEHSQIGAHFETVTGVLPVSATLRARSVSRPISVSEHWLYHCGP